ncbi:hypothetical protein ACLBOM_27365 [Escherichia coli]
MSCSAIGPFDHRVQLSRQHHALHHNGTEAGAAVVKNVTMGSLLFAIIASMVAWALILTRLVYGSAGALATTCVRARRMPLLPSLTTSLLPLVR